MRKLLCALLISGVMCGCSEAYIKVGFLRLQNTNEEEYRDVVLEARKRNGWNLLDENHDDGEDFYFYDSLVEIQLAMARGDIGEVVLPRVVGEYIMNNIPGLTIECVTQIWTNHLVFGFEEGTGAALRDRVNEALSAMRNDGTLDEMSEKYLHTDTAEPQPVTIEHFDGADTVRVAVTGDLPPIDFISEDGTPAGFSTAVLAEVGRRLRVNVVPVSMDAGSRTAALTSGRVDSVFWYQTFDNANKQHDAPDGVILSDPYYTWNQFLHLGAGQSLSR